MARLAGDPRIMTAACQQEGDTRRRVEGDFMHRPPGRDMLPHRAGGFLVRDFTLLAGMTPSSIRETRPPRDE